MRRGILLGLLIVLLSSTGAVRGEDGLVTLEASVAEASSLLQNVAEDRDRLDLLGFAVSGWTELAFTAGTAKGDLRPLGFNYRSNDFLLQQNWLRVTRDFDDGLSLHSDWILPGSDYQFTRSRGLFDSQAGRNGIDPVQFFLRRQYDDVGEGLELTLGRFFAPFGIESIAGPNNTLVSHSYSFIYNPFTQTGGLANLTLDDNWSLKGGVVLGSDLFLDESNSATFLSGFHWTDDEEQTSVDFLAIVGNGSYDDRYAVHNPRVFDLVVTRQLNDALTLTLEGLGGYETNTPGVGTANWFSGVGYLDWEVEHDLKAAVRLELFNDEHGNRTGSRGLYTAVAGGLAWHYNDHLLVRPELRLDHNDESRPFGGDRTLFTATIDLIVFW